MMSKKAFRQCPPSPPPPRDQGGASPPQGDAPPIVHARSSIGPLTPDDASEGLGHASMDVDLLSSTAVPPRLPGEPPGFLARLERDIPVTPLHPGQGEDRVLTCHFCGTHDARMGPLLPLPCDSCPHKPHFHRRCVDRYRCVYRGDAPTPNRQFNWSPEVLFECTMWADYDIRGVNHTDERHLNLPYRLCWECKTPFRVRLRKGSHARAWWELWRGWPLVVVLGVYLVALLIDVGLFVAWWHVSKLSGWWWIWFISTPVVVLFALACLGFSFDIAANVYSRLLVLYFEVYGFGNDLTGQGRILRLEGVWNDETELDLLPVGCFVHVWSYLSYKTIVWKLSLVSKAWYDIAQCPNLRSDEDYVRENWSRSYLAHNWIWKILYRRNFSHLLAGDSASSNLLQMYSHHDDVFALSTESQVGLVSFRDLFVDALDMGEPCGICSRSITPREQLGGGVSVMRASPCDCEMTEAVHRRCHTRLRREAGPGFMVSVFAMLRARRASGWEVDHTDNVHAGLPYAHCSHCQRPYELVKRQDASIMVPVWGTPGIILVSLIVNLVVLFLAGLFFWWLGKTVLIVTLVAIVAIHALLALFSFLIRLIPRYCICVPFVLLFSPFVFCISFSGNYYNYKMAHSFDVCERHPDADADGEEDVEN